MSKSGGVFQIDDVTRTMSKGGGGCAWCSAHPSSDPPPTWLAGYGPVYTHRSVAWFDIKMCVSTYMDGYKWWIKPTTAGPTADCRANRRLPVADCRANIRLPGQPPIAGRRLPGQPPTAGPSGERRVMSPYGLHTMSNR